MDSGFHLYVCHFNKGKMADVFDQLALGFQNGDGPIEMLHESKLFLNRAHVVSNFHKVCYNWIFQAEIAMMVDIFN